jgi:hypothetical protein
MLNTNIGVTLPSIFADGMVLQRNKKVPVWGWGGNEGDTITAVIGSYSAEAKVDANGDFYLELPEMKGATDQTLMIRNGNAAVTIKNVGIGEVWYCSGQSNMELKIGSTFDVSSIVANASKYDVRTFKVSVKADYELQKDVTGGSWSQVTSSNASKVTAIGYIAAYQIQKALGVPVALIECYEGAHDDTISSDVIVAHAVCRERAEKMRDEIMKINPNAKVQVLPMGPVIGSHTGPGFAAIIHFGNRNFR